MNEERFRRLQEIFQAAIERKPEERISYARQVCGSDAEMRAELLGLLASHREDDTFLDTTVLGPAAFGQIGGPLTAGQDLGPYRILHEIGRGGMGVVYLAEDTRLHRQVALKALSPELLSDPRQQERFRREARAAASLSHPGIATVYALEEFRGRFYLASEYVPGDTLRTVMSRTAMPFPALLDAGLQIAEGLAAAHQKGVVHRDLKPDNILRDSQGRLKIVDFGLALIQGQDSTEPRLTQASLLLGTPAYMSPEQLAGDAVDFRSDLFSFGILLLELATGRHPFEGKTALQTTARILENEPIGLEELSRIAPGLGRLIARCLRKQPRERQGSTAEVVGELRELSDAGPPRRARSQPAVPWEPDGSPKPLASTWWTFHQAAVIVFYAAMAFLLAWNTGVEARPLWTLASVYGVVLCAIGNGALRLHLLFTAHFNPRSILSELDRSRFWTRAVDGIFVAALLAGAATIVGADHLMAGILAAAAVAYGVVFLVVEPSTARSVFPAPDRSDV